MAYNKRLQLDNLQAVRFAVSLSLHFTAKRPSYKLRLKRALYEIERHKLQVPLYINAFVEHSDYQYFIVPDRIEHNVLACIQWSVSGPYVVSRISKFWVCAKSFYASNQFFNIHIGLGKNPFFSGVNPNIS